MSDNNLENNISFDFEDTLNKIKISGNAKNMDDVRKELEIGFNDPKYVTDIINKLKIHLHMGKMYMEFFENRLKDINNNNTKKDEPKQTETYSDVCKDKNCYE